MTPVRKLAVALAAAACAAGLVLSASPAAQAAGQICAQSGTGYCLNDWNGVAGGPVKMGQNGWPHQAFGNIQLTGMCNGGRVSSAQECPFANHALNDALNGQPIEEIRYTGGSGCVGLSSATSTGAVLTACPNNSGTGGGWGVIYVQDTGTCVTHLDSVRATDTGGTSTPWNLRSGGATGAQAIMSTARDGTACWGTG